MPGVDEEVDVVIVGGGPAGTVLATLLAAAGRTLVVFERGAPESLALGTGILLQPNGLSVLYGLGLREELHDVSVLHRAVPIKDELGRSIATCRVRATAALAIPVRLAAAAEHPAPSAVANRYDHR
jgi:2-polyprenyl-6-methoxyphenol hydroxylase-like FAD-dependent oxidoreductase